MVFSFSLKMVATGEIEGLKEKAFPLSGQMVLVTGGGRGLGEHISRAFGDQGASLFLTGTKGAALKNNCRTLAEAGVSAECMVADNADWNAISHAINGAGAGQVCVLVNNSGLGGVFSTVDQIPLSKEVEAVGGVTVDQGWDNVARVNFIGAWWYIKLMVDLWRVVKTESSRENQENFIRSIVNISTMYSMTPYLFRTIYTVPKAALRAMTYALAGELAVWGISIADIQPELIFGDRNQWVVDNFMKVLEAQGVDPNSPKVIQWKQQIFPTMHVTYPEVANMVVAAVRNPWVFGGKTSLSASHWPGDPNNDRFPVAEQLSLAELQFRPSLVGNQVMVIQGTASAHNQYNDVISRAAYRAGAANVWSDPSLVHDISSDPSSEMLAERLESMFKTAGLPPRMVIYLTGTPVIPRLLDYHDPEEFRSQFFDQFITQPVLAARQALRAMQDASGRRRGTLIFVTPSSPFEPAGSVNPNGAFANQTNVVIQSAMEQLVRTIVAETEILNKGDDFRAFVVRDQRRNADPETLARWLMGLASSEMRRYSRPGTFILNLRD